MTKKGTISIRDDFANQYLALRKKEGRLFSDEELSRLPRVSENHPLRKEWKMRERSSDLLADYISRFGKECKLLEIGCGNGWLSNRFAKLQSARITGIDINHQELEQARRVFKKPNLEFIYGSPGDDFLSGKIFNLIVFAASIQYFPSVSHALKNCMKLLSPKGEIHIIDSHFYAENEKIPARIRSQEYFQSQGAPLMHSYYFHHGYNDLQGFPYKVMNKFQLQLESLSGKGRSFPWICIKKQPC
jgi:ubiquinone/menaquinone biosynthesis C-methylase UbiE